MYNYVILLLSPSLLTIFAKIHELTHGCNIHTSLKTLLLYSSSITWGLPIYRTKTKGLNLLFISPISYTNTICFTKYLAKLERSSPVCTRARPHVFM